MSEPGSWGAVIERHGLSNEQSGQFCVDADDPIASLSEWAASDERGQRPTAKVNVVLSTSHEDYARIKASVSVTIPCPATEPCIDLAGEIGFTKAQEILNNIADVEGLPRV